MKESDKTEPKQKRKGKHLFKPGQSGNPKGRPKGTISIITAAKKELRKHPEKLKEIVQDLLNNEKLRLELIRQIDGMPKQKIEAEFDNLPFTIKIVRDERKSS